ncbi:hypothetical protein ABZ801_00740 [Actinomadura sp. NPDC047616]|uniref:hypothetical protein n=1 Tax=Actinomadura sp. NPDC047616 TaxID=3155914 RepID=UPI0033DEF9C4
MSETERKSTDGLIASELAGVSQPWNIVDPAARGARPLFEDPESVKATLRSVSALLQFMANHGEDIAKAKEGMPDLANAYWIGWQDELVTAMPLLSDMTWHAFDSWAADFDPSWIDRSWQEPPPEFIQAVAWIWCSSKVESAAVAAINWLIQFFRAHPGDPLLPEFLDLAAVYTPRAGKFGARLVGMMGRAGKDKAIPYLDRVVNAPVTSGNLREVAEDEIASLRRRFTS